MAKPVTASTLITHLLPEAIQTEESATVQAAREADRLGAMPPGRAMREISEHARRVLPELRRLCVARGHRPARRGTMIGRMFSSVRTLGADLMLSMEKSYRGTLLGAHHGVGTLLFLEDIAIASGDQELADFCSAWVTTRKRLVDDAEDDLAWFAAHPSVALSRAKPPMVAKLRPIGAGAAQAT